MNNKEPRTPREHKIKLKSKFFDDEASGKKPFTVRKLDRDYRVEDTIRCIEIDDGFNKTGRTAVFMITYILRDYAGLEDGYGVLGLECLEEVPLYTAPGAVNELKKEESENGK